MLDSECGVLVVVRAASHFPPLLFGVWFFLCATPWTAAHQASLSFLSPRVCSDSCPLSRWCHPTVSSPIVPLSSCLQSVPASGSFPMSWLFASGGQRIGAPASASVLPMNIQGWFPLVWSPCNPMDSQESSPTSRFQSINSLVLNLLYGLSHLYMTTGKTIVLTRWTLLTKWRLCFLICCLGWS